MDAIPRVPEALDFPPVQLNFVDTYTNTTTNEVESSVRREGSMQRGGPTARHRFASLRYFFPTCDDPAPRKTTRVVPAFLIIRRKGAAV